MTCLIKIWWLIITTTTKHALKTKQQQNQNKQYLTLYFNLLIIFTISSSQQSYSLNQYQEIFKQELILRSIYTTVNIEKYLSKIRHCKESLRQLSIKRRATVMHLCKEFYISDDIISATDHIFLTQLSTLHKNDISFIREFMKISRSFSQNLN